MYKYLFTLFIICLSFYSQKAKAQAEINLVADTLHAPFLYGVASGDPTTSSVILWTAIELETDPDSYDISWEIALDNGFNFPIQNGTETLDPNTDWTLKIDVTGLDAYKTYYYRFSDIDGNYSVIGRTRTAPENDDVDHLRFAVASCSSLYSGYFNAYRQIAEREDIDAVMHMGDYIYDFVDSDEEIRVPSPYPDVPQNLQEWRDRHKSHLADPDLRAARQQHPWITIHDNHEVGGDYADPIPRQAFLEYVPVRLPDSNDIFKFYREFKYGDLVDIFMLDINTYRNVDVISGSDLSLLGDDQYNWLKDKLQNSTAKWNLIGQQKLVGGWNLVGLPDWFPGDGTVFDENSWDGNDAARDRLLNDISAMGKDNVIFLSGDLHMSFANDLSTNPFDGGLYDGSNGDGSIAVEFMPASVSRGNFDEAGVPGLLIDGADLLSGAINPHHVWADYQFHGYGILDVQETESIAEFWFTPILEITDEQTFATGVKILDGENHWERNLLNNPSPAKDLPLFAFEESDCNPFSSAGFALNCTNLCLGDTLYVYNNSSDTNNTFIQSYELDFGNNVSQTNPSNPTMVIYQNEGTYNIMLEENLSIYKLNQLTVTAADCDDIFDNPDIYVEIHDPINGLIYTSSVDDSDLPNSYTPNLNLDINKTYQIKVYDEELVESDESCGNINFTANDNGTISNSNVQIDLSIITEAVSTNTYTETIVVGGSDCWGVGVEESIDIQLQILPNPAKDNISVSFSNPKPQEMTLSIYNVLGQVVKYIEFGKVDTGLQSKFLDISNLSKGSYFLVLKLDEVLYSEKLITIK